MSASAVIAAITVANVSPAPAAIDPERMLWVIRQLETGDRWDHRGGAYQFKPDTWADYTAQPYSDSKGPIAATVVAMRHLRWILAQLSAGGMAASPGNAYLVWRFGLRGFLRGDGNSSDLGERAENLYGSEIY